MKPSFQYFKVSVLKSEQRFEFSSLKDFISFTELNHHKTIFLITDNEQPTHFAVTDKGALFQQVTEGFKLLEDYVNATRHHFPDSASYYESLEMGYQEYEDFKLVKEVGISDKLLFEKMRDEGFIKGHGEYLNLRNAMPELPDIGSVNNPYQLYQFADKQGFASYADFKEAWKKGFTDAASFKVASEKGYQSKADFDEGSKKGFGTAHEFESAKTLKIRDREDYLRYNDLVVLHNSGHAHDQCVLINLISKLPQDKKVSFYKIEEFYKESIDTYKDTETGQMPGWFTTAFDGRQAMMDFLAKNEQVKELGTYDKDGEYFETKRLQERKVVIDGSNVAHNSKGNAQSKPRLDNIVRLIEELKKKGFTEIKVIADASLKHRISDHEVMPKMKEIAQYQESPAETAADMFIIQVVKNNRCLLVSNDTFREWKVQDPWVAENIDFYRLSFMIDKDHVILPDLK